MTIRNLPTLAGLIAASALLAVAGCSDDDSGPAGPAHTHPFLLQFVATDGADPIGCGDTIANLGPGGTTSVEISDLRFYVSNIRVYNASGTRLSFTMDSNEFQYVGQHGSVALIDLTDTSAGACAGDGITYPEGTARVNDIIMGQVGGHDVTRVTFDIGIPQRLMKDVIAANTAEGAPSPLAEMHWSWAYAYRFFVMNFVVHNGVDDGEGYLHVGSNDCGGDGTKALTDQDACGKPNAASVSLTLDPAVDEVAVDLRALLSGVDMLVDNAGTDVPGCECHSSASQPDCAVVFANLGIDQATGTGAADLNTVFKVR